jgi:hypothetical protein
MNNGVADALVSVVEKEMAMKQPTSSVWKRAAEMELRVVNNINGTAGARNVEAAQGRLPDTGISVGQGTTANTEAKR